MSLSFVKKNHSYTISKLKTYFFFLISEKEILFKLTLNAYKNPVSFSCVFYFMDGFKFLINFFITYHVYLKLIKIINDFNKKNLHHVILYNNHKQWFGKKMVRLPFQLTI